MDENGSGGRGGLRAIPGGRHAEIRLGHLRVVAAGEKDPPFPVGAIAAEEDTWLVLSAQTEILPPPGHPVRVMTEAWESEPEAPGTVIVAPGPPGSPLRLLAVVHDVDAVPTWREEWVGMALDAIFGIAEERGLGSLGLPLLGTKHGDLEPARFLELLRSAAERSYGDPDAEDANGGAEGAGFSLQRVWLVLAGDQDAGILRAGTSALNQEPHPM